MSQAAVQYERKNAAVQDWRKIAAHYARPVWRRALWQLANTAIPFVLTWIAAWQVSLISWWLVPPVSLLASGFLIRLFIIQHDAGHCSWSPSQRLNNWVGRVIGVLTFTPYSYWRRTHGIHHATNGDLDHRIAGDIPTITLQEYLARGFWGRWRYRFFRLPTTLFLIGPFYQFVLKHRFPWEGMPEPRWPFMRSALYTDLAIVAAFAALDPIVGWQRALALHLVILMPGLTLGVWLFYIQHNHEYTYWRRHADWSYGTAAFEGSSYYQMPRWLNWLTGDIAVHHVHHLSSRIPNYRLREVLRDHPELEDVSRIGFVEGLRCARLHLWDEETQRMLPFSAVRERLPVGAASASESA